MQRALLFLAAILPLQAADVPLDYPQARTLLAQHCQACHGGQSSLGGFNLDRYPDLAAIHAAPDKWQAAAARLRDHEMPPKGLPGPQPADRDRLVDFLHSTLRQAACAQGPIAGPALVRRLNRSEYAATIRDLLSVHINAGAGLPADGAGGEGFDNAAETLFLSPIHAEKYLEAAREALAYAYADPESRKTFFIAPTAGAAPQTAAEQTLAAFLPRAFRRPVSPDELHAYLRLFTNAHNDGETYDEALLHSLRAALISPHFLFLVEQSNTSPAPRPLSDFELASRVSYFLWGSMPDPELLRLAQRGVLHHDAQLEGKVLCMLDDERTREFSERFVEQWLGTRELGRDIQPDPVLFPEYADSELRAAMRYEPILFFDELLKSGGSLLALIDSDWTVANKFLLKHYGLPSDIEGLRENPIRVPLPPGSHRGGLLGMASILAVSSLPSRTSPVLRGKWALENLLGLPPPPAPPNVPELQENHAGASPKTMRERLEQHRANPACATCHDRIDPIGFGLENFDVLGRWRTEDAGQPIDASGVLPDGSRFNGPAELRAVLLQRKDLVIRNLVEKLLGYALGRGLTLEDSCAVDQILDRLRQTEYNAHTLILEIIRSKPFRYTAPNHDVRARHDVPSN